MNRQSDLRDFLQSRRARLRPENVGILPGERRRVAGLRREELAGLAGISVDYYVRLEQGRTDSVSEGVLSALADALRLTPDEHSYLRSLASSQRGRPAAQEPSWEVRPSLQRILDSLDRCPAMIFGRRLQVLAWNGLAAKLVADFGALPPVERNLVRLMFLDDNAPVVYPEWPKVAQDTVSALRLHASQHPDDPELDRFVEELSRKSEQFRRCWARHDVRSKTHGKKLIRHPIVGLLSLTYETSRLPDDSDQGLLIYSAEPDSADYIGLQLLAAWQADAATADSDGRSS
jgi:transcriptional regulator with XRE-family HTH domain